MHIRPAPALTAVLSLLAASPVATPLPAQEPVALDRSGAPSSLPEVFPLHSHPDDPAYGIWGSGRGFKAQFAADRISLHPYVAADRDPVRLDWSTAWIGFERDGATATTLWAAGDEATTNTSSHDFTVHRGTVVENWELRAEGLAQTFHFTERPVGDGDLVVRGRIGGSVSRSGAGDSAHRTLEFVAPDGTPRFRYGRAYLVDADGARTPLATSCVSGALELHVPAALLRTARWPFHIDPLLSPIHVASGRDNGRFTIEAVAAMPNTGSRLLITRMQAGGRDADLQGYRVDRAGRVFPVFADLNSASAADDASVVYVAGSRRFVIVYGNERLSGNPTSRIRVIRIPEGATSTGQTSLSTLPQLAGGGHDDRPAVSGNIAVGQTVSIVARSTPNLLYDRDNTNGRIHGVWMNVTTGQINRSPFAVTGGLNTGYTLPCALPVRDDIEDQFVYAYLRQVGASTSLHVRRQKFDGTLSAETTLVPLSTERRGAPSIAGGDGQYCVGTSNFDTGRTEFHRFAWPSGSPNPTELRLNTSGLDILTGMAFDHGSRSHWVAAVREVNFNDDALAIRLGWNGNPQTSEIVSLLDFSARVAWTDDGRFVIGSLQPDNDPFTHSAQVADYVYPDADDHVVGPGCNNGGFLTTSRPTRGDHYFTVRVASGRPNSSAVLLIGFAQTALPLDFAGFPGCTLHVDPANALDVGPLLTAPNGSAHTTIPLDEVPAIDVFMQWLVLSGSGPSGASAGARVEIR